VAHYHQEDEVKALSDLIPSPFGQVRGVGALAVAVALVAALLYANTAGHGFAHDDVFLIEGNPTIRVLDSKDFFAPWVESGYYRPIVITSLAVNYAIGALDPLGYHLLNIAVHALISGLVLALFWRITGDRALSLAGALLFAAHPIHTEAVANVSGRPDLLAGLFSVGALLAYVSGAGTWSRRGRTLYALSLACFGLGLLCKENTVTVLGIAVLYDVVYRDGGGGLSIASVRAALTGRAGVYAGYLAVAIGYVGIRLLALEFSLPHQDPIDNPLLELGVAARVANALLLSLHYLWLLFFPLQLSYDYSWGQFDLIASPTDPRLLLVGVGVLAIVAALFASRRSKHLFFGMAFYWVAFFPVSNTIIPIGTIFGERLVYLPSVGFCLALAAALRALAGALVPGAASSRAFAAVVVVAVGVFGWRTVDRNPDWKTTTDLWVHDAAVAPGSVKVQTNAGVALLLLERPEEALRHFEAAIAAGLPASRYVDPHRGSVFALAALSRRAEASEAYDAILLAGFPRDAKLEAAVNGTLSLRELIGKGTGGIAR
jgi:hypothetical protein